MQIRTRLTILFTLITATILLVFAAVIYYSAKDSREKEFYARLEKEAATKANLFFNVRVNEQSLQEIYRNNRRILDEVEVAIYDTAFHLLYHDAADIDVVKETPGMIENVYENGEIRFYQGDWQVIGLRYLFENKNYVVVATAYDQYGYRKLRSLLRDCIVVFIISILVIYIAGHFFSRKAFDPVRRMTENAKNISANNLGLRLPVNGSKDEVAALASTFNEMLNRLENSFDAQRSFVSNISHELRTPLAAIITELEISTNKERSITEYKLVINNALADARKLVRLSNSLLDLAKASYDPSEISFKPVRIDEVLLDARQQVRQADDRNKINIHFDSEWEDDTQIYVSGNEYLLKVAFSNLFENGCKFSGDRQCAVSISFAGAVIVLRFIDKGIGIKQEDIKNIFTPFYRGENKKFADGNGIGLSLTQKIINLHNGRIAVSSTEAKGTVFTVELPHVI